MDDAGKVSAAIRKLAARLPAYITLKDVKKRWGHGQEDIFPVAQFEKLWGDMSSLPEVNCRYFVVPRARGQQLVDSPKSVVEPAVDARIEARGSARDEPLCMCRYPDEIGRLRERAVGGDLIAVNPLRVPFGDGKQPLVGAVGHAGGEL